MPPSCAAGVYIGQRGRRALGEIGDEDRAAGLEGIDAGSFAAKDLEFFDPITVRVGGRAHPRTPSSVNTLIPVPDADRLRAAV
jgi:hypothetical protein